MGALLDKQRAAAGTGAPFSAQCFTKWCPSPRAYTAAEVDAALATSARRMRLDGAPIPLLQFHWWDYAMRGEMMATMRHLDAARRAGRIRHLGLTNFDTPHVAAFLDAGIPIVSNQVQFSLLDTRPARAMAPLCAARGVALLTYGTLMGGMLTDAWLGVPEPRSRAALPTPSLGKYFNMVKAWGSWDLFQELLRAARAVADRHGVDIAHVAIKWVLDQPAVGGVIVGLRAGLSEHADDNARAFGVVLTDEDRAQLAAVQARGRDLMAAIGDCGDEYRG